jgi:hypothetical protein
VFFSPFDILDFKWYLLLNLSFLTSLKGVQLIRKRLFVKPNSTINPEYTGISETNTEKWQIMRLTFLNYSVLLKIGLVKRKQLCKLEPGSFHLAVGAGKFSRV